MLDRIVFEHGIELTQLGCGILVLYHSDLLFTVKNTVSVLAGCQWFATAAQPPASCRSHPSLLAYRSPYCKRRASFFRLDRPKSRFTGKPAKFKSKT
jgi:hypothetical protein